jgi:hypothetical protein
MRHTEQLQMVFWNNKFFLLKSVTNSITRYTQNMPTHTLNPTQSIIVTEIKNVLNNKILW